MKRRSSVGVQWVGLVGLVTACAVACSDPPRTDAGMDAATSDVGSGSDAIVDDAPVNDGGVEDATDASTLPDCGPPGTGPMFTSVTAAMGVGLESAQLALAPDGTPRMVFRRDGSLRFTAGERMGETWSWVTTSLPRPVGVTSFGYGASLYIDSEGTVHVASVVDEGLGTEEVNYHRRSAGSAAWTEETIEMARSRTRGPTAITGTTTGAIAVAFVGSDPDRGLQVVQRMGTAAWTRHVAFEGMYQSSPATIVAEADGTFASAVDAPGAPAYTRFGPSGISMDTVDLASASARVMSLAAALSPSGIPVVVATSREHGYLASVRRAGIWQPSMIESDPTATSSLLRAGRDIAVAVDAMDRAHVIYIHQGDNAVRYAHQNGCAWDLTTLDTGAASYGWVSIALDASGAPHMAFLRTATAGGTVELRYAR